MKRLQNNASTRLQKLGAGYDGMAQQLKNRFEQMDNDIMTRWQEDPNSEKRWIFLQDGREEEAFKLYDDSIAIAQSSLYLEAALSRDSKEATAMVAKIEEAKKEFIRKRDIALDTSRMPEAVSKDKKLLAIAKEILEKPKADFGEHGKIVLTTKEIVERERTDSEVEIDDAEFTSSGDLKMSGSETSWTYKWQEFKFAVPLKETDSETWHIWWITAKNFSSGGARTPLNQWISGTTTKGNPILKKHL